MKVYRKIRQQLAAQNNVAKYTRYAIGEIILVVIGILIALSINNWNENRKNRQVENRILTEIANGLQQDLIDIKLNIHGHQLGLKACEYWINIINKKQVDLDSLITNYKYLTRDFISAQNTSGYESLKSKGLEFIHNDSVRLKIITLYEQEYVLLKNLEEEYQEAQFYKSYYKDFNDVISPSFIFNQSGDLTGLELPVNLSEENRNKLLSYLWKIRRNREFVLEHYSTAQNKINQLLVTINTNLK